MQALIFMVYSKQTDAFEYRKCSLNIYNRFQFKRIIVNN